ncbi:hypothetical protein [Dongshaea marina]|nr:hypothetical protein [Dongshaea marina]
MTSEQTRGIELLDLILSQHDPQFLLYLSLNILLVILIMGSPVI